MCDVTHTYLMGEGETRLKRIIKYYKQIRKIKKYNFSFTSREKYLKTQIKKKK